MLDNLLRQTKKIIIDPGHGGSDTGTSGNGLKEKDLALSISEYMYNELKNLGYPVSLVRNSDTTLNDEERINKILSLYGNNKDVILISNHFDSDEDNAQIIYALRNNSTLPNLIYEELEETGLNVKEPYQLRLPSDTSKDYYYVHRNSGNIEPIMLQYGNLSNSNFSNNINNNYTKYADAVVKALSSYLGNDISDDYYTVKSGDTLYSIAKKFNISVDKLKELNKLPSNIITIGQRLKVTDNKIDEPDENIYVVKSGDTLYAIAQKYNTTVNKLLEYNNLNSSLLSIGQKLKIPPSQKDIEETNEDYITYTVKKGDNLYDISRRLGTSVNELMNFNNLTTNLLSIGQILKIPITKEEFIYTVKKGDSLYSIARTYNTTVDNIKNKNNLKSDILSIGQKLII